MSRPLARLDLEHQALADALASTGADPEEVLALVGAHLGALGLGGRESTVPFHQQTCFTIAGAWLAEMTRRVHAGEA